MADIYEGVAVWGCLPGSPSARAGVRAGDIVLSVNGVRTKTADAFISARDWQGGRMVIRVVRNGVELDMTLEEPTGPRPSIAEIAAYAIGSGALVPPEPGGSPSGEPS